MCSSSLQPSLGFGGQGRFAGMVWYGMVWYCDRIEGCTYSYGMVIRALLLYISQRTSSVLAVHLSYRTSLPINHFFYRRRQKTHTLRLLSNLLSHSKNTLLAILPDQSIDTDMPATPMNANSKNPLRGAVEIIPVSAIRVHCVVLFSNFPPVSYYSSTS